MTLKKGTFRIECDEGGCDEYVDLETYDFDEALSLKHEMTPGWTHYNLSGSGDGRGFKDYCPIHDRNPHRIT